MDWTDLEIAFDRVEKSHLEIIRRKKTSFKNPMKNEIRPANKYTEISLEVTVFGNI